MKRRLLSAFLAVMMVLTMAPVAFAADEDAVAKIGDATYSTLVDAVVNAKTGDTIVMTADTDISETGLSIASDKDITLDLNGCEVKAANTGAGNIKVYGKLTLKDSTDTSANGEGQGKITTVTKTYIRNQADQPIIYAVNGDFVMQSGLIDTATGITNNSNDGQFGVGVQNENTNASVTIEGGKIKAGWYAVSGNGQMINHDGNITVNGGILESTTDYAIYNPQKGTTTINGGVIYGQAGGIAINRGSLVINDGMITSKGIGNTGSWGDGTGNLNNAAIHANANYGDVTVSVKGGKVIAEGDAVTIAKGTNYTATVSVSGGTFSSNVSEYCEKNYYTEQNADNTYTVKSMKDVAVAKIGDTYYKTLADAVTAADNTTVTLLKDTTENVTISTDKTFTLDLNGYTLSGGKNNGNAALLNEGTVTIKDSSANKTGTIKREDNADQTGTTYYVIKNNGTMTIEQANVINNSGYEKTNAAGPMAGSSLICNGDRADDKETTLTINDGVFEQQNFLVVKNGTFGILNVNGGKFTSKHSAIQNWYKADIMGGEINGQLWTDAYTWGKEEKEYSAGVTKLSGTTKFTGEIVMDITLYTGITIGKIPTLEISGGEMNITNWRITSAAANAGAKPVVSGGYFTTNPSDYVASGYVAGTSDVSGYSYKVVAKTDTGNVEVKPAVAKPEVKVDKIPQADKEKVAAAAATVSAPTLGAAAGDIVKDIDEAKATDLVNSATEVTGDKKLYVQSSLKVEPTAYDAANKTLALEITPQYRVVASTADTADKIKLDGDTKNAQVVQDYQPMNITKATVVTMELPTGFAVADGAKLSIKHTKSNGKVEYYTGTVTKKDNKLYLTFTTNGFSPFVISVPAAAIESKVYPTLQAAVDSAKNGDIIDLYKDVAADTKVTVAKTIKFEVATNEKTFAKENIVAGANTTVKVTGDVSPYTYEFTYTKPSSGGSSGGSSSGKTTYKVTTSAVNNGGVNASPSNAEKGATITITLSPDKGYKLDKLTVTDGSGKTVSTVKKSDTVYTFTMPASAVKVGVSYVKATETPSKTKFNDVSANDWFASAVDYVTGKGMMNGTADNTFSPKANTTRGMVVTVLYRLENQPSTSAASFTDVASGAYYANAVAWANANGIVSGYGSGKFGPNDKVTREQLAAILYRYAQYKKYDVSVGEDTNILSYDDAQSISSYAIPAIQWACGAGVVTGKSGSKLDPKGNATRAEVAAMLMRFCENVK
ncbi:S-layer homology domain-containing protein [Agathobaculum butyriciproducens]|uniref:S-layer homology domain-containing protein n=1 Tax=Agathobaculum butyriciproducens TaxID=1628085 RepID=UPI003AF07D4C